MVPNKVIERVTYKRNLADAAQDICIRRRDGGRSVIGLKSFDRFRESFQGTAQDVIWVDEEPPADVHAKCLLGLMTTNGLVMCSFTPLRGLSDIVLMFMPAAGFRRIRFRRRSRRRLKARSFRQTLGDLLTKKPASCRRERLSQSDLQGRKARVQNLIRLDR